MYCGFSRYKHHFYGIVTSYFLCFLLNIEWKLCLQDLDGEPLDDSIDAINDETFGVDVDEDVMDDDLEQYSKQVSPFSSYSFWV